MLIWDLPSSAWLWACSVAVVEIKGAILSDFHWSRRRDFTRERIPGIKCSFTFSQCLFQLSAGHSHYIAFAHFHSEFFSRTVKLRKSLHLQIYYVLCALPTPLFGDNILHQSKHRAKGNSEESQKMHVCALGWVGAGVPQHVPSGLRSARLAAVAPQCTCRLIQPPVGKVCGAWLVLGTCLLGSRLLSSRMVPPTPSPWDHRDGWAHPPGTAGQAGQRSGFTYIRVASKIICGVQLKTKRSPWVGGKWVPVHNPGMPGLPLFSEAEK